MFGGQVPQPAPGSVHSCLPGCWGGLGSCYCAKSSNYPELTAISTQLFPWKLSQTLKFQISYIRQTLPLQLGCPGGGHSWCPCSTVTAESSQAHINLASIVNCLNLSTTLLVACRAEFRRWLCLNLASNICLVILLGQFGWWQDCCGFIKTTSEAIAVACMSSKKLTVTKWTDDSAPRHVWELCVLVSSLHHLICSPSQTSWGHTSERCWEASCRKSGLTWRLSVQCSLTCASPLFPDLCSHRPLCAFPEEAEHCSFGLPAVQAAARPLGPAEDGPRRHTPAHRPAARLPPCVLHHRRGHRPRDAPREAVPAWLPEAAGLLHSTARACVDPSQGLEKVPGRLHLPHGAWRPCGEHRAAGRGRRGPGGERDRGGRRKTLDQVTDMMIANSHNLIVTQGQARQPEEHRGAGQPVAFRQLRPLLGQHSQPPQPARAAHVLQTCPPDEMESDEEADVVLEGVLSPRLAPRPPPGSPRQRRGPGTRPP